MQARFKIILVIALIFSSTQVARAEQTIDPHILPNFYDFKVPKNLQPTLSNSSSDYPKPYFDHCHTQQNMANNNLECAYGNLRSNISIVLFGDSHALSWFPALEKLVVYKKWRLVSLTMSSCWPAQIPAWNSTTNMIMDNCTSWRNEALAEIAFLKPKYVFVAGTSGFSTVDQDGHVLIGQSREDAWIKGMTSTLNSLTSSAKKIFYLSDYPIAIKDPVGCLKANKSVKSCVNPLSKALSFDWLQTEHDVAINNDAIFIDGTEWICDTDPCAPIQGNLLVYRDAGHLTATFAKTLFSPLYAAVKRDLV